MCYSATVMQAVKSLGLRYQARIQLDLFESLFHRRLTDSRIRIPRALERDFLMPENAEERIRDDILAFRRQEEQRLVAERDRQRARLDAAERALAVRATKKAAEEKRIATAKIAQCQTKLEDRCVVALEPEYVPKWLNPADATDEDLLGVLADRQPFAFRPQVAREE